MQLPILKHLAELLKTRKEIAIETTSKKGRGMMIELIEEHIKQFPWLNRDMMKNYINTHHSYNIPIEIDTHHQTIVPGITDTSPVTNVLLRSTIATTSHTESSSTEPTKLSCSMTPTEPPEGTS
jgi:pyruvate/2-oxoglutarate dehydrogenase complex dihydrolipoamide acyltransferase (E2) component